MKRRLLFLFAVFMVATSVGWGQTDLYVSSSGSDDAAGGSDTPLATIAKAIEKATDGATIHLAEGTFPVSSTIPKALTIVGEGKDKSVLKGYLVISAGTQKNVSFQNVQLTNEAKVYSSPTKPVPLILMKDQSAVLSLRGCALINNAKGWYVGYGEGVYKKMGISIQSDSTALGGEIHLINSSIMMAADNQSGISCNGAVSQLTIDHSSITVNEYPRSGIFGIDVHCDGMNVDISKSTIELGKFYYPIYILGPNQTINIKDESLIKGWCAIYANAVCDNSVVNVSSSKLVGYSEMTGASNGFSTLPIQATMNVRYVITDSEIQTSVKDQTISPMTPISFAENTYIEDSHANNCYVELRGNTIVSLMRQDNNPAFISDDSNYLNRVLADQSVKFRTVDASGNEICEAIVIRSAQGDTVRMALDTTAFKSCLTSAFENDNIILPIGTYTLPQTLTLDRSQGLIGAGKDKTIVNGHIFVNSPSAGSVTLTASDMTLKGTDNSSAHGLIGMIGTGKDIVKLTNCKLDGGAVTAQTAAVGVRMESVGAELSLTNTDIDVNYYGIGLRNKEQVLDITGGTFTAWGAIMTSAGGLNPSDGTLANTNTRITAKDATFISRTLLNGISNSYGAVIFQEKYNGVTADFTNCELRAVDGLDPLINATQATATDIRSYGNTITFTGCTLSSLEGTNNLPDGSNGYLHAGVIRLGWSGTDDKSEFADNTITINNSTLNGKEGENWVYSHRKKEAKTYDKLTINGTVYDPASGLICYGGPDIQNKIDNAVAGETISVPAGEHAGFNVTTADIRIKGVYGKTIIKGAGQYAGSPIACVSADKVTLMNLSFKSSTDGSNRPTALFVGGGTVEIDSCIFEDKLLQTGLYSEPGSTLKDATLLVHNSTFNVYDKNLLISAGRLNATVKNNVFTDSDISVAKNDGSNVVESNEFHNCVVKVEDGVTFQYNKMYPGDQTYVYSIRPNNLEGTVVAPNNYWGSDNPDFSALIDKSRAPNGSVDYFPYYSDVALGTLIYKMVTISEDTVWATPHPNQKVTVLDGATLTLSVPMSLDTVTMREGAQIKSNLADQTGSVTTKSLRFSPDLSGTEWKAFGMPFTSAVIKNSTEEEISAPSAQNVDNGIWFARLKDNKTPEFVVDESAFGMAGLWAANGDTYKISSEGAFEFKTLEEPAAPTETGTFLMCSNPNTFTITLKQSAYILTADGTSFEQEANPEIKPFQSFVLTDAKTLSTLRSLRIGDGVVTGNQTIEPVDGYYVTTDRGAIEIHTPEPMDVVVIGMNGKVTYRGEVTDGQRIMVPSGIYAVNGQLVRVK